MPPPPPNIFLPKNSFLATDLKMGKQKRGGESGERGVCILRTGSPSF